MAAAIGRIVRGLFQLLLILLVVLLLYASWAAWSFRDLAVENLESRYGGSDLQRVDLDGTSLAYKDQGQGPVLLLIHSHFFSMRMWNRWADDLSMDYRVIRFDMTSHGLTGPEADHDYSMDRDLELIEGLLRHLGVGRLSVVGSSLGGNMAFHFAARHPQRVDKLVLINSGGLPRAGRRGTQGRIPVWVDYLSYLLPPVAYRKFLEWMVYDDSQITEGMVSEFHAMFRREGNRFAEFERLRDFDIGHPDPVLASVRAPTLVIWGAENPQLPVELVEVFRQKLSGAPLVSVKVLDGVGHLLPVEAAEQGIAMLRTFLAND